jgi:hypothetical protein
MARLFRFGDYRRRIRAVFFSRTELNRLLGLYSGQVMRGQWRDYAIDQRDNAALFSVFRHTHESPVFTIAKYGPAGDRPGNFALFCGRERLAVAETIGEVVSAVQRRLPAATPIDGERYR